MSATILFIGALVVLLLPIAYATLNMLLRRARARTEQQNLAVAAEIQRRIAARAATEASLALKLSALHDVTPSAGTRLHGSSATRGKR